MNTSGVSRITRRARSALGALLTALLAAVGLIVVMPTAANAATLDNMLAFNGFHVGAFRSSNGDLVYCLEPAADTPFGSQLAPRNVSSLPGYSVYVSDGWGWAGNVSTSATTSEQMRQMNWIISEHGPGASPERAVEIQLALWEIRREPGNAAWIDGKLGLIAEYGGQAHVTAGRALADEARRSARGPGYAAPDSGLAIELGTVHGTGTVSYPAGTTKLRIEGGKFPNGSSEFEIGDGAAGTVTWTASLHESGWNREHTVNISGDWERPERYWPAELILYPAEVHAQQRLGAGVASVSGINRGEFQEVSVTVDSRFAPTIVTQTPTFLVDREDGTFTDLVTVASLDNGAPWPSYLGTHLELEAHGTLYGPFATPQVESSDPPFAAPVAARTSLLLDRGPAEYEVSLHGEQREAGYYYWVWEVREDQQTVEVRNSGLLEPGGVYADNFGVSAESQLVASELRWITALKERELSQERLVLEDSIRVSLNGGSWVRDEFGERIPATIRFTVYQSDEQPERLAEPPVEAREIGRFFTEVSTVDEWIDAPPFDLPAGTTGWVTVRACLFVEDQEQRVRGYLKEWCDDFGVPEETARIIEPEIPAEVVPEVPVKVDTPRVAKPEPEPEPQPLATTGSGQGQVGALLAGGTSLGMGLLVCLVTSIVNRAKRREG